MRHCDIAQSVKLEHGPKARAATLGGAIEIAGRIHNQACSGMSPIAASGELMEYGQAPGGGVELEHVSSVRGAAPESGAVEVAGSVHDERRRGLFSISSCEAVEYCLVERGIESEHDSGSERAAESGGAIEVTRSVHN